jgi:hypothetical protein
MIGDRTGAMSHNNELSLKLFVFWLDVELPELCLEKLFHCLQTPMAGFQAV